MMRQTKNLQLLTTQGKTADVLKVAATVPSQRHELALTLLLDCDVSDFPDFYGEKQGLWQLWGARSDEWMNWSVGSYQLPQPSPVDRAR